MNSAVHSCKYSQYVASRQFEDISAGFDASDLPETLKDFQMDIVHWSCRRGRAAIFADTGLGKTIMQLAWADQVVKHTGKPVLIAAPLCVAQQTVKEGEKFGISVEYVRNGSSGQGIHITNYEMLHKFTSSDFAGIVLDESSILKGMDGKMRKQITGWSSTIPYRLSCTATPSPNDFMELGTQAEFLGVMSQVEMLAMFFIHDGSDTSKWRLKGHGRARFWEWLATWAMVIRHPADLGYESSGYDLPKLKYESHICETGITDGLFVKIAQGLQERNQARRESIELRTAKASEIANSIDGPCIIWCHLNDESQKLEDQIDGGVQVYGSMKPEIKESLINKFTNGDIKKLITKPKIAGFGMNWQHCHNMIFVGLSDSWESFYQAVRRCWRFGQDKPVTVYIISADTEGGVLENIRRKQQQNEQLGHEMAEIMRGFTLAEIQGITANRADYKPTKLMELPSWK